jgi:rhomboid family GlyGly-CTERM serine protease
MSTVSIEHSPAEKSSRSGNSRSRWLAPITLFVSITCFALFFSPAIGEALQFDRNAFANGECWRIFTGHLAHWNAEHLLWDVVVFAVLGALCEQRERRRYLLCLIAAAILIPLSILLLSPTIATYRGLSGLNAALFTLLAGRMLAEKWTTKEWRWVMILASLVICFGLKVGFEVIAGESIFVDGTSANFQNVPLAHIIGALVGLVLAGTSIGKCLPCPTLAAEA